MAFTFTSPSFEDAQMIPGRHSRHGGDVSPALDWSGALLGTESVALTVFDPDPPQGIVHHRSVCDIPAQHPGPVEAQDTSSFTVARNVHGENGWTGPNPPTGRGVHHYHFIVTALDVRALMVTPGTDAAAMWRVADGHVVAKAEIVGTSEMSAERMS